MGAREPNTASSSPFLSQVAKAWEEACSSNISITMSYRCKVGMLRTAACCTTSIESMEKRIKVT
eukprot:5500848-Amphidinium_carterae.1